MSRSEVGGRRSEHEDVLDFWFGPHETRGKQRAEWFRKDDRFDAEIRERFGELHQRAASGELDSWRESDDGLVALVVVLDQFSRNLFRADARAFAQDSQALECARHAVDSGLDLKRLPVERLFLYLPFEHSEDLADQDRCVALMQSLEEFPETRGIGEWAEKHRVIVRRFGRFPHRNAALGRASTPEEVEFLKQPGSGF
jgi:uncharacterized protein (DUF924 family)